MKLRNKKTGGIWDIPKMRHPTMQEDDISFFAYGKDEGCLFSYHSLAELNEEWEDYKPKEPLIKDEKIRKAVRAWAEACDVSEIMVVHSNFDTTTIASIRDPYKQISFSNERAFLPMGKEYSIDELCGEEE